MMKKQLFAGLMVDEKIQLSLCGELCNRVLAISTQIFIAALEITFRRGVKLKSIHE